MSKLVRDRIPELVHRDSSTQNFRVCDPGEMFDLLRDKLIEEATELRSAKNRAEAYEELADVVEVVEALLQHFEPDHLAQVQTVKSLSKGRFEKGFVLEDPPVKG